MSRSVKQKVEYLVWGYLRTHIESNSESLIIPSAIKQQLTEWVLSTNLESAILSNEEIETLYCLLSNHWNIPFFDMDLLYSGVSAKEFYEKCGVEHTLCVIEGENTDGEINVFGGYTSQKWGSPIEFNEFTYKADPAAFLYLIRSSGDYPPAIFPILDYKKHHAIASCEGYMCFFGKAGDADLWVMSGGSGDTGSDTIVNRHYDVPVQCDQFSMERGIHYLLNSINYNFTTTNVEVFKVNL